MTANTDQTRRGGLGELPPPSAEVAGWYPDPLGSTGERYWDGWWRKDVRPGGARLPAAPPENGASLSVPSGGSADADLRSQNGAVAQEKNPAPRPSLLRLLDRRPSLTMPPLGKGAREQRAREREEERQAALTEAARLAFLCTPPGRARTAFERGQRLFQYSLDVDHMPPMVIPGRLGAPAVETLDPVDVLNAVNHEGWKLVSGKFIHVDVRGGLVGCYLFKRSQKRRERMNDPWLPASLPAVPPQPAAS